MMRKWLSSVAALSVAAAAVCPLPTLAAEYLLGPQDKVRLKIYEWRPSRDTIFEWTALNDDFVVGADGMLFLPFLGQVRAQGTATGDLARSIGGRLMQEMRLGREPDVAVEIVQFRPFYIIGHVTQPGEFAYRPGLTVLQALGIAGGLRTREENLSRLEREVIAGRGDIRLLTLTTVSLLAKKSRLEAEMDAKEEIVFPPELTDRASDATVALLMEQERLIFAVRKEAMTTQLRALRELRDFLHKELTSLEKQLTFHDKQVELVQKELSGVSSLVQRGLAVAPREISLERTVAQLQSDRLAAETSLLRVRQEMSKTENAILEVNNRQANEVAASLRETQMQLGETMRRTDTATQLLYETEVTAPTLLALRERSTRAEPIYKIVRITSNGAEELTAKESTPIEPGDTIKVEIPMPGAAMLALPPASGNNAESIGSDTPLN